ncbi:MAG: prepilin-type N-terminal cleavage/methylation domain-containing protein [Helicobacteraceae bacterium]|jgi:prepilin-type N-terminal cleavage/methylation domain-containing protein|nr:prepilin-type N-terminal cleavage/methylation domain-containing protein [Helicobacteraceae bacterium]
MRRLKRGGFTLIELVFALVIIAIVGTVSADVIMRVYEQYIFSRDFERGQNDTRRTLDIIAARLQYRIKNSVIGRRLPGGAGAPPPSILPLNHENIDTTYPMLEWVGISYESQRANDAGGNVGWSGAAYKISDQGFYLPRSNLTTAWTTESEMIGASMIGAGIDQCTDWSNSSLADRDCSVFVFAGDDLRGDYYSDQNNSWGWSQSGDTYSYFRIKPVATDRNITLESYGYSGTWDRVPSSATGTARLINYYIVRSAYALTVEKADPADESGDLVLYYDYRPWLGEGYADGKRTVMLRDVTNFLFKEQGSVVRLVLCVLPSEIIAGAEDPAVRREMQFCREKVVL